MRVRVRVRVRGSAAWKSPGGEGGGLTPSSPRGVLGVIPCGRLATASGGTSGGEGGEGGEVFGLMVGSGGEGGALGGTSRLILSLLGVGPDALGVRVAPQGGEGGGDAGVLPNSVVVLLLLVVVVVVVVVVVPEKRLEAPAGVRGRPALPGVTAVASRDLDSIDEIPRG